MLNNILLVILGSLISPVLSRYYDIFRSRFKIESNPQFFNLKIVRITMKITDKIEPYLFKSCGILSFTIGLILVVIGFQINKVFSALIHFPFFMAAGYIMYTGFFPLLIKQKQSDDKQ